MKAIEIKHEGQIIAIIIPNEFHQEGIVFLTPNEFSQQLAYMNRPKGYKIQAHTHNKVQREVFYTLETLFLRKGEVRVDFYTRSQEYIESRILKAGDVMMLVSGGHGFTMLKDTEMIEVKQGPYAGEEDKIRFKDIRNAQ